MNPDIYSPEYCRIQGARQRAEAARDRRKAELHAKAVVRRRKAKRGGKR